MKLKSFIIAFAIQFALLFLMASSQQGRIDVNMLNKTPSTFYKLYQLKQSKATKKTVVKKKKEKAKSSPKPIMKRHLKPKVTLEDKEKIDEAEEKLSEKVIDASSEVENLVVLNQVVPKYPKMAHKSGIEAKVFVEVIVDKKGYVKHASIKYSSKKGYGFEESAINAVKKLKFKPLNQDGEPVSFKILYPIDFVLLE